MIKENEKEIAELQQDYNALEKEKITLTNQSKELENKIIDSKAKAKTLRI